MAEARGTRITDARGVTRRAVRGDALVGARLGAAFGKRLKSETKRELRRRERVGIWLCVVFGLVLTGVFALQIGFAMRGPRIVGGDPTWADAASDFVADWFVVGVAVSAGLMVLGAAMLGDGWRRARGRALVRLRRCGCCLYELEGLAKEADGCVVCPECGAAWRVEGASEG